MISLRPRHQHGHDHQQQGDDQGKRRGPLVPRLPLSVLIEAREPLWCLCARHLHHLHGAADALRGLQLGTTPPFGVQFVNGAAFIGVDQHVPFFEVQPESEESIKKRNMHYYTYALTEKEREAASEKIQGIISAQRQREAMSTAERAVLEITKRPGYTAEFFSAERLADLQGRMSERANQRRKAEAVQRAKINAETVLPPGFMK